MKEDLISVIVCVYNAEDYLSECIKSILKQTYKKLQIILIDDGSSDKSGEICDYYKSIDNRVEVIHQENKGVSATRNIGINSIKGKYFSFIDSDDYIDINYIFDMYKELLLKNADIVFCDIMQINTMTNKKYLINKEIESFTINNKNEIYNLLFKESRILNPINKLYKTSLFNELHYPNNIIHEDTYLIVDLLNRCNCISYINKPLYFRNIHENSIMTSKTDNRIQEIDSYVHWLDIFNNNEFYNKTLLKILNSIINNYSYMYNNLTKKEKNDLKNKFRNYKDMYTSKLSLKYKIKFFIFEYLDLFFVVYKKKGVLK